jgi:hypothetical protein
LSTQLITLDSQVKQFQNTSQETQTQTYSVQVPNDDGTTRTETRTRTVKMETTGGIRKNTTAVVVGDEEAVEPDSKVKRAVATSESPQPGNGPKRVGRIRFHTAAIKNGLRLHGEFEKDGVLQLMIFPELLLGLGSIVFQAFSGE